MKKLRIFVSSVQKELEIERVAVAGWVSADPQLSELCDVVLFEKEPLTVAQIKRGNCQPCSRNPILGQYLNHLRLMDQRGSGIGRMKEAMLNHGLGAPLYDLVDGYFRVTLCGPGDNLDRLRTPAVATGGVPPSVEAQLTERQTAILEQALTEGFVTSGWCRKTFGVAYQTVYRDLQSLLEAELIQTEGSGRSTRYIPVTGGLRE